MKKYRDISLLRAYHTASEPESMHVLSDYFWRTILIVCTLLIIGSAILSLTLFIDVNSTISETKRESSGPEKPIFDKAVLHSIVETYEARGAAYHFYSENSPKIADPSK